MRFWKRRAPGQAPPPDADDAGDVGAHAAGAAVLDAPSARAALHLAQDLPDDDPRRALLLEKALQCPDRGDRARAALLLGGVRQRRDDLRGALRATRAALTAGDAAVAPHAWLQLATLLQALDDDAGAEWALDNAAATSGPDAVLAARIDRARDALPPAPTGMSDDPEDDARLGLELEHSGDIEGAAAAYRRADRLGSADGASNIGFFHLGWNEPELAEECYRRADQRGSRNGSFRLGMMLQQRGELDAAEAAYTRGLQRGSWRAAANLGYLRMQRGNLAGAVAPLQSAEQTCDDPDTLPRIRGWLTELRTGQAPGTPSTPVSPAPGRRSVVPPRRVPDAAHPRSVVVEGPLTEGAALHAADRIRRLDATAGEVAVLLDSPGGTLQAALALYDELRLARNPVATYAIGQVSGLATLLLAAGTPGRRYAVRGCRITLVGPDDRRMPATDQREVQRLLAGLYAEHTGRSQAQIRADWQSGRDLTPEQARAYGLVDEIVDPG